MNRIKIAISLTFFVIIFFIIWKMPISAQMNIQDWMKLIILEIPLQLGIHFITEKKCK